MMEPCDETQMRDPHTQASLLGLPVELRDMIYGYLFPVSTCRPYNPVPAYRGVAACDCRGLALTQVCRQTRQETIPLFVPNHEFRLLLGPAHRIGVEAFIQSRGDDFISEMRNFSFRGRDVAVDWGDWPVLIIFALETGTVKMDFIDQPDMAYRGPGVLPPGMTAVRDVAATLPDVEGRPVLTKQKLWDLARLYGGWDHLQSVHGGQSGHVGAGVLENCTSSLTATARAGDVVIRRVQTLTRASVPLPHSSKEIMDSSMWHVGPKMEWKSGLEGEQQ